MVIGSSGSEAHSRSCSFMAEDSDDSDDESDISHDGFISIPLTRVGGENLLWKGWDNADFAEDFFARCSSAPYLRIQAAAAVSAIGQGSWTSSFQLAGTLSFYYELTMVFRNHSSGAKWSLIMFFTSRDLSRLCSQLLALATNSGSKVPPRAEFAVEPGCWAFSFTRAATFEDSPTTRYSFSVHWLHECCSPLRCRLPEQLIFYGTFSFSHLVVPLTHGLVEMSNQYYGARSDTYGDLRRLLEDIDQLRSSVERKLRAGSDSPVPKGSSNYSVLEQVEQGVCVCPSTARCCQDNCNDVVVLS